jgi:glyoxylase-like metal-dependent hydrolase (beta-lactamase superfamily II)
MGGTTRRNVILSAAVAAAAFGLDGPIAISAPVRRAKTPDPTPGFHRFRVGAAHCTVLYDGIWEKAHDPAYFSNATVEQTKKALARAGLRSDFIPIPISALVVNVNGKLTLCDAGGGGQVQAYNPQSVFTSGNMIRNMRSAGIDPRRIETILISHFHPDHIFGLMEKDTNKQVYPNAELVISDVEYKFWTDPAVIDRLPEARKGLARRIQATFPTWKNMRQVEGEAEVAPGIRFVSAPGHTPGHRAFHLSSGANELMISNDTAYVPALVVANPGWRGVYDQDGATAEASRRRLLDRVIADKMMICGYHFPFPGAGTIAKDGTGYALTVTKA